jgi:hypothetical protein
MNMRFILYMLLLFSVAMNDKIKAMAAAAAPSKKRCAFGDGSSDVTRPSKSRPQKKSYRPRGAGGLSHTAPALSGPVGAPELTVLTTKDSNIIRRWLEEHVAFYKEANSNDSGCDSYSILGFDIESIAKPPWRPDRADLPDGPATIQLSTPDSCLIVQLATIGDGSARNAPSILRDVVNNPKIIKVGVGIDDDALELYRWSRDSDPYPHVASADPQNGKSNLWEMTSRFDIGCILPSHNPGRRIGLREVAKTILGVEIQKNKRIQMSNWGNKLTSDQISYAARDAWVSAAVLDKLQTDNSNVFGAKALAESDFMRNQRGLKEIDDRAVRRKDAKIEYKALVDEEKESGVPSDKKRIQELKERLVFYRPDYPPSFSEQDFALPFY